MLAACGFMTPEIHFVSSILSVSFVTYLIICFFLGYTGVIKCNNPVISDKINIGYIEPIYSPRQEFEIKEDYKPKTPPPLVKSKPQPKPQPKRKFVTPKLPKPEIDNKLVNDCILALQSLGFKKSEAKREFKSFFNNHSTVEQFITDYFNKVKK